MSASPAMITAFTRWRNAELTAHYACGCPDEVMGEAVDAVAERVDALADTPARNGDDLALKTFALAVMAHEPMNDGDPLLPVFREEGIRAGYVDRMWISILADLPAMSPLIAQAMAEPHRDRFRGQGEVSRDAASDLVAA